MTRVLNRQLGKVLSLILSVAMLVTGLPVDLLGGFASVKAEEAIVAEGVEETVSVEAYNTDANGDSTDGIDVWDFGAEKLDETIYNNKLTVDIINGFYPKEDSKGNKIEPGTSGINLPSFKAGDLSYDNAGATNHRLRTSNTALTRYDSNTKKSADGTIEYKGNVYSNSAKNTNVFMQLDNVKAGDIITVIAASNGTDSTIKFDCVSDPTVKSQQYVHTAGSSVAKEYVYYAAIDGSYKFYSVDEKLVVCRVLREHTKLVTVSGDVDVSKAPGLTNPTLIFANDTTGAAVEVASSNGKYEVKLNEQYSYTVTLKDANGYVVSAGSNALTIGKGDGDKAFPVAVEKVPLKHVSGNITVNGKADPEVLGKVEGTADKISSAAKSTSAQTVSSIRPTAALNFSNIAQIPTAKNIFIAASNFICRVEIFSCSTPKLSAAAFNFSTAGAAPNIFSSSTPLKSSIFARYAVSSASANPAAAEIISTTKKTVGKISAKIPAARHKSTVSKNVTSAAVDSGKTTRGSQSFSKSAVSVSSRKISPVRKLSRAAARRNNFSRNSSSTAKIILCDKNLSAYRNAAREIPAVRTSVMPTDSALNGG